MFGLKVRQNIPLLGQCMSLLQAFDGGDLEFSLDFCGGCRVHLWDLGCSRRRLVLQCGWLGIRLGPTRSDLLPYLLDSKQRGLQVGQGDPFCLGTQTGEHGLDQPAAHVGYEIGVAFGQEKVHLFADDVSLLLLKGRVLLTGPYLKEDGTQGVHICTAV